MVGGSRVWHGDNTRMSDREQYSQQTSRRSQSSCSQKTTASFWGNWTCLDCRPDAVTDFLAGWKVIPVKTFRQGYRRTWVVRAAEQPMSTKLQHDFGLAVIKRTAMQKTRQELVHTKMDASSRAEEAWKQQFVHRPGQQCLLRPREPQRVPVQQGRPQFSNENSRRAWDTPSQPRQRA